MAAPGVVLDTNVLLDWLVFRDARVQALAAAVQTGALRWLASLAMRQEFQRLLAHASLSRWAPDSERALAVFDALVLKCPEPARSQLRCTDADDQVFIDLALAQRARWLVTHDRALLKLSRRACLCGVEVLTPQAWQAAAARAP